MNYKLESQRISAVKIIGIVTLALVTVVMFGVYQGYKQNQIDYIDEITAMKLSHGWKPEKACSFLSHLDIKPTAYIPTKKSDIFECSYALKMPYSKGEALIQYRVNGVQNSATKIGIILSITDNMATKENTESQNLELKQLQDVFSGVANDLMFVSSGRVFQEDKLNKLKNIKLGGNIPIESEIFVGSIQHYKIKSGLTAYSFELKGKEALKLPSKQADTIQKK